MRIAVFILATILGISALSADEVKQADPPKSPAATSAIKDYDKAVEAAEKAYKDAKLIAEHKLIEKLKLAETLATKSANLPEANAIDAQIKAAQTRIEEMNSPAKTALATYSVWQFHWKDGKMRDWILADGTVINEQGSQGTWTKEGKVIVMDWGGAKERVTISADGKTSVCVAANGNKLAGDLVGTNLTGAPAPPAK